MADPDNDTGVQSDREPTEPGIPRWVKVSGIIVAILAIVVVAVLLLGGNHGPGRHQPSGDTGGQTVPAEPLFSRFS